jgi:hypothetical protein
MKGYRTIIFSALMTLVGMIGWKVSPDTANHWVDVFLSAWGIGAILIRQITTTPVGNPAGAAPALSAADLTEIGADLKTLIGHSSATLGAAQLTANMSQKFDLIAAAIQAAAAANAAPPVPAPAPQAGLAVPASPPDAPVPASAVPAQPLSFPAPLPEPLPEPVVLQPG